MKLIVYVDDDEEDFFLFKKAVNEISDLYSVLHVKCSENLFDLIKVIKPSFIFLDIHMPVINGVDCLKNIRSAKKYDGIPVIIYSSYKNYQEISYSNKANYYLVKPDSFAKILASLNSILTYNWADNFYPSSIKLIESVT